MQTRRLLIASLLGLAVAPALASLYDKQAPIPDIKGATRPRIMLTGYWPPTNEMLRAWSPNPAQNGGTWQGGNWEGRGYDVYSFFPEFPGGTSSNPKGNGDFEVDYQDTSADWWRIVEEVQPTAIITFSRANTTNGWEFEGGNRTYAANQWSPDYLTPTRPTADLPIMQLQAPGTEVFSTLPIDDMIANVQASGAAVSPFRTVIDDGAFLSNFIGYHGNWYKQMHSDPYADDWVVAAGHIHVGRFTDAAASVLATQVTLRTLLDHVDQQIALRDAGLLPEPGSAALLAVGALLAIRRRR